MKQFLLTSVFCLLTSVCAFAQTLVINETGRGTYFGTRPDQAFCFYGCSDTSPTPQRAGAAQSALTDSTSGSTANATLAAGVTAAAPAALTATAPAAATVSTDIGAFTDPPSAAQMAALRTFVNALKADNADLRTKLAAAVVDLGVLRTPLVALVTDDGVQNANDAKIARLANELRAALVEKNFIKGAP